MNIGITLTSSMNVGQEYIDLTNLVAKKLAINNFGIVYGGTDYGMMSELAKTYKDNGGDKLIGVMANELILVTKNYKAFDLLDEQFTEETMEDRKKKIITLSDGFIILPGGYGTFEEMGSIIGGNVNKLYSKPIVIYNHNHFYDTLIAFFNEMYEKKFSKIELKQAALISDDINEIISYFQNYEAISLPDKFVNRKVPT